ncbi:MAG: MoxR family ATPase, partial [Bacteroidia bacterium]|nr:MoxR family ATPase [Bacteroidia bacterium]
MNYYQGNGEQYAGKLPNIQSGAENSDPGKYVAEPGLRDAVNVALNLGMPLLLTGDPGTGKTQLAYSLGYELAKAGVFPQIFKFNTKTTSVARDLFYRYDSLGHFRDVQLSRMEGAGPGDPAGKSSAADYISFEALGLAILLSLPAKEADPYLPDSCKGQGPVRSIVLIDEIDKAPRDLPN